MATNHSSPGSTLHSSPHPTAFPRRLATVDSVDGVLWLPGSKPGACRAGGGSSQRVCLPSHVHAGRWLSVLVPPPRVSHSVMSNSCDPMQCSTPDFLSFTISQNLLKLMSSEPVMSPNHLILCCPLLHSGPHSCCSSSRRLLGTPLPLSLLPAITSPGYPTTSHQSP